MSDLTIYSAPATEPNVYPLVAHLATWTALAKRLERTDPRLAGRIRQRVAGHDGVGSLTISFSREEAETVERVGAAG